jgi:SPP1 family predicted phage head-tail adaptor
MQIGKLRTRIEILAKDTPTHNSYGEEQVTYSHFAWAWAYVEPLTGNEAFKASQLQGQPTYKILMRYIPDMGLTHKIVLPDASKLDITSLVNANLQGAEMVIMAKESK